MLQLSERQYEVSVVQRKLAGSSPTEEAYRDWLTAYDYFNRRLFDGRLPACLLTLTRRPRTLGYFAPGRFRSLEGAAAHEISLNPHYLEPRGDYDALSTLVHEQCHLARHEFGPRNRKGGRGSRGYHDRAWARVMLAVGLVPSHTGLPGGRQTGGSVSHYAIVGGAFDLACRELLIGGFAINWRGSLDHAQAADKAAGWLEGPAASSQTRSRFVCAACGQKAWARASARLACLPCNLTLIAS